MSSPQNSFYQQPQPLLQQQQSAFYNPNVYQNSGYQPSFQPSINTNQFQPTTQNSYPNNNFNRFASVGRLAPIDDFNEPAASNNMDDLIDVMAKRRIALKRLESEMNKQHSRGNSILRSN
jgi:hypothetical protein